ncbi:nucleoside hydrolase [Bacillus sp. Y1]|nr:nucleoside hydrolase [Bacillus sp. Y1]AYA75904.1 nucleoside hydrolase [Bacillus sp. Y1]
MKKVLLFGDPGIDDAVAIIYALLHPEIELVGVVTGYGNVNETQVAKNAAYLLQLGGRQDIPVIRGAKGPFSGELVQYYPEIHGPEGLGPIRPPDTFTANIQDFSSIFKIIETYKSELTIVDVGRSTSLATSFILAGSEFMNQVNSMYIMGGAFNHPGNVTASAEANFYGDPIASDLVLEKGRNITILPLNVTNYSLISPQIVNYISSLNSNPFSSLFKPIMDYYINAYNKLIPGLQAAAVHDVLTLYSIVSPESFQFISRRARVDISNFSRGTSSADFRAKPDVEPVETLDKIALSFNYNAFIQNFVSVMTSRLQENNVMRKNKFDG